MEKTIISLIVQYTIIFYYQRVIKWTLFSRTGQTDTFSDPLVEKNRVRSRKNISFTRVVVTLAWLRHQTLHSQNTLFFPSYTIYYYSNLSNLFNNLLFADTNQIFLKCFSTFRKNKLQ